MGDCEGGGSGGAGGSGPLRVVVTGGSSGIGYHIVEAFAAGGHLVFFSYLSNRAGADALTSRFRTTRAAPLDQGRFLSVCRFAAAVAAWAGPAGVDVLVNNAALGSATVVQYVDRACAAGALDGGLPGGGPVKENDGRAPAMELRRAVEDDVMMRVNALGPLWVTERLMDQIQQAARVGRRRRAVVVFIGSVGGGGPVPFPEHRPADGMSKAASCQLARHFAARHVRDDIDVFCLNPGATDTNMFAESTLKSLPDAEAFIDHMPKRRLIRPQQIAAVVLWLSTSSAARVFHGGVVDASMGLGVRPGLQTEMNVSHTKPP